MEAEAKRRRDWKGERELVAARIDDPLAQDLRTLAEAQGQTVTEVLAQALRAWIRTWREGE